MMARKATARTGSIGIRAAAIARLPMIRLPAMGLLAGVALVGLGGSASPQPDETQAATPNQRACAPHESVTNYLGDNFEEKREAIALTGTGELLEVYVSEKGSWTIVVSNTQGLSCIVGAGEAWEGRLASLEPQA